MTLQVSAVLLASGSARRMGRLKQLLPINDRPVIRHCLDSIISAGIMEVITVVRPGSEGLLEVVSGYTDKVAFNERPERGMAASVIAGLKMLDPETTGVLICLADHPMIASSTYGNLVEAHFDAPRQILVPVYRGRKGHPALFPADVTKEIYSNPTLRDIIRKDGRRVRYIQVPDEGVVLDMDTHEDYNMIMMKMGGA